MPDTTQGEFDAPIAEQPVTPRRSKTDRWDVHDKEVRPHDAETK